jgi:hypothetical protein
MARLRQQHPQNYVNSGNIHTDFENVIRYLNSAELGDKTVSELLRVIFDEEGVFNGPIQMRVDTNEGLQYRVGQYADDSEGWYSLVDIGSLRGPAGQSVGNVEGPFFFNRKDTIIGSTITAISVTAAGSGYTSAGLSITLSAPDDPDGVQATATATLGGTNGDTITAISLTNAGSGYAAAPTVTITGGNGSGATATSTVGSPGSVIPYTFDPSTDEIVVYRNGILLFDSIASSAQYAKNASAGTVTLQNLSPAVALGDKVSIYSIRSQAVTNYRRADELIAQTQQSVAFIHSTDEKLLVFRNGVLQQEGGSADYLASSSVGTITFLDTSNPLTSGEIVTIITVENQSIKTVAGLMFEDEYTDDSGFIIYNKLSIQNNEIPQNKVSNLSTSLAGKANLVSQQSTPTAPATGDLWLDTNLSPAILKFYDGTQWLETSPESSLPTFVQTNANEYVRVNGTGTGLEYGDIDFSALVPKTYMGAANGVATLDTGGKMPVNQLPETFSTQSIPFFSVWEDSAAAIGNKTYFVTRLWKQTIRIDGIAYKLNAGSCTLQLSVDGTPVGNTYSVTTALQNDNLATVIEIDATVASKRIELVVTNNSGGQTLEVSIAAATVNV